MYKRFAKSRNRSGSIGIGIFVSRGIRGSRSTCKIIIMSMSIKLCKL